MNNPKFYSNIEVNDGDIFPETNVNSFIRTQELKKTFKLKSDLPLQNASHPKIAKKTRQKNVLVKSTRRRSSFKKHFCSKSILKYFTVNFFSLDTNEFFLIKVTFAKNSIYPNRYICSEEASFSKYIFFYFYCKNLLVEP